MNKLPPPALAILPDALAPEDLVPQDLVEHALDDGADSRGGRQTRHDGWTPERIRAFLTNLANCGCVDTAAKAAGMSKQSAYALRNRVEGRAFHYAWEAALQIARRHIADGLVRRAIHGCVDRIVRNGVVVAERHRFDNRLSIATLTRLEQRLGSDSDDAEAVRIVIEEFDAFVDIVGKGGAGSADFIWDRRLHGHKGRAERLLQRLDPPSPPRPDPDGPAGTQGT